MAPVVSSLWIFPIKSCGGIQVQEAHLSKYGLLNDRIFTVIDPATNIKRTMRELPRMVLIEPKIDGDNLVITAGDKSLTVPLNPDHSKYESVTVNIWDELVKGADMGDEAAKLFSDFLEVPCRLVHKSPTDVRAVVEHSPGPKEIGFQPETAFADNFPILVLSEESVADINTRLETPVKALNFRPNVIVTGVSKPWDEDMWVLANIHGIPYYFSCRCTRCSLPNVDPVTGVKDKLQPQKTLQSYRRVDKGKKAKFTACVGINAIPGVKSGVMQVGDVIEVKQVFEGERKRTGANIWATSEAELDALTAAA
ncbi:hypothetical protein DFQ27_000194 [Actinomortierella ambigua]|uniref:MOSC domain-containing protein n=1 Tax=Actinomortierella ambigua TaxID=1343610 RepID=A0A9P6UAA1_9FUNG|nr:hypothetical protein DFQ27_000194 [Actinomortierella ambigua]